MNGVGGSPHLLPRRLERRTAIALCTNSPQWNHPPLFSYKPTMNLPFISGHGRRRERERDVRFTFSVYDQRKIRKKGEGSRINVLGAKQFSSLFFSLLLYHTFKRK